MVQEPSFEPHVLRGEQRGAPPVEPLTWLLGGEVGEADAMVVGQPGLHDGVGLGRGGRIALCPLSPHGRFALSA